MKIYFKNNNSFFETSEKQILLLKACRKAKASINFGCRIGICGTCKVKVKGDLQNINSKNEAEKLFTSRPEERLACQCIIKGDIEIEQ